MEPPTNFNLLPAEVLLAVGKCLDRKELAIMSKVCKHAHRWFQPQLWCHIKRQDWQQQGFPIAATFHDGSFDHLYSYIQSLEWSSHELLLHDNITPIYPELDPQDIVVILDRCRRLRELTLFEKRPAHLEAIFSHLLPMSQDNMTLKGLSIIEPGTTFHQGWIQLEALFPLFASLDKLSLGGCWFYRMDPVNNEHSEGDGMEAQPWQLNSLQVPMNEINLIELCPNLVRLDVADDGAPRLVPALEHLELDHFAPGVLEDEQLHQALYDILLRRPRLKILRTTIAIKQGYNLRGHPEANFPWTGVNLEQLHLSLIGVKDPNIVGRLPQGKFWDRVLEHLQALPRLWRLSLYCWNANRKSKYIVLQKLGGIRITTYTPLNTNPEEYRDHLDYWLEAFPRVRTLVLDRSKVAYIQQRLDNMGRSDIRCYSVEEDVTPFSA
ncbi:hypothetical protein BGZ81_011295 [Podila clonocystis]|nr:hypothetical protein BGZ81_011295 [Podila clonocystis]